MPQTAIVSLNLYFALAQKTDPLRFAWYLFKRIAFNQQLSFSRFILRIATAAVALSVAVMIITTSLVNGFQHEIRNKVFGFWAHIHVFPYSFSERLEESPTSLRQDFYDSTHLYPAIQHVQAVALKSGIVRSADQFEGMIIKGVGNDYRWASFEENLLRGSVLDSQDRRGILLSAYSARRLSIDTGDHVIISFIGEKIRSRKFTVKGIYSSGLDEYDKQYAFVPIQVIQGLNRWDEETVGGFEIYTHHIDQIDAVADNLYDRIADPALTVQSIRHIESSIFDWLSIQSQNETIVLSLMLIVAFINMVTALLILILERTRMIGTLKALGAQSSQLRWMFMLQAGYIVVRGVLIGNLIGLGLCWLQWQFGIVSLPEESYYLSKAAVLIDARQVLLLNLGTIVACFVVLLLPSQLVQRIQVLKAIRFN